MANQAEALWWFAAAESMLVARDWLGCRTCAIRARDMDPGLSRAVDEIIVIATTLQAGEWRTRGNRPDWYAILGVAPSQSRDVGAVATRYRNLAHMLNPQRNRFPFADRAMGLVHDAWTVLSDPVQKSVYDRELGLFQPPPVNDPVLAVQYSFRSFGQQPPPPPPTPRPLMPVHAPMHAQSLPSGSTRPGSAVDSLSWSEIVNVLNRDQNSSASEASSGQLRRNTFWTVCPYCLYVYQYEEAYINHAMKCNNCKKVFQAVVIQTPPSPVDGQEAYHARWEGTLPFGQSIEAWNNGNGAGPSGSGIANMNVNEETMSSSNVREILGISDDEAENGDRQTVDGAREVIMADFGVEMDNEFAEPGTGTSGGDDDDGHNLFEGLDEYLRNLPAV